MGKNLEFELNTSDILFERKNNRKSLDIISMLSNGWILISNFEKSSLSADEFLDIITKNSKELITRNLIEFTCTEFRIDDIRNLSSVSINPNDHSSSVFTKNGNRLYGKITKYHN